jgi:hypothetical protein
MNKMITNMFTGIDNSTHDVIRILGFIGAVIFLGCTVYQVWITKSFDGTGFSTGFGALLGIISGSLKIKETTEPK